MIGSGMVVRGITSAPGAFTVGGQVLAANGTAAAPSISFASDTNTGRYLIDPDSMGDVVAGLIYVLLNGDGLSVRAGGANEIFRAGVSAQAPDLTLTREGAGQFGFGGGGNGQQLNLLRLTELTTIAAAATTDTTIQMPAGAIILGVSVRVTVVIPTAATFTVGDSGSAARFNTGANVSTAVDTTNAGTKAGAYYNASALAVRITPNAQPANNSGRVRVTIHYLTVTPPTS